MPRSRPTNATSLGLDLDRLPCPRRAPAEDEWILLEGCRAWSMAEQAEAMLGRRSCPICGGRRLKDRHYCLCEDAAGLDRRFGPPGRPSGYPGLAVDAVVNEGWTATPTKYEGKAKASKGLKRKKARAG